MSYLPLGTDDTLPHNACIHTQDGYTYNTNLYHLTLKLCLFHHQCCGIIHTTAGSVTPWNIRCILMTIVI